MNLAHTNRNRAAQWRWLMAVCLMLSWPLQAATINEITYSGNKVTKAALLDEQLSAKLPASLYPEQIEALRQSLLYLVVPYALSIAVFLWTSTKIVKDWEMAEARGL